MNLEELFSTQVGGTQMSVGSTLGILGAALVLGLAVALLYKFIQDRGGYNTALTVTLAILPVTLTFIIVMLGNNLLVAFTFAGVLTLVRYRSVQLHPKDIAFILLAIAVGVACGIGYLAYAVLFAVVFSAVMIVLTLTGFGGSARSVYQLRILIPETLSFDGVFDDVLNEYSTAWRLCRIRTTDFGTVFEMDFSVKLKKNVDRKEFLDKVRCKNGNLQVTLNLEPDETKV